MRKRKTASRLLALLCSLAMVLSMLPMAATVYAEGDTNAGVAINEASFPDEALRNYVQAHFDTDRDGSLSEDEIRAVLKIPATDLEGSPVMLSGVTDLRGIEKLTSLTSLNCSSNKINVWPESWQNSLSELICIDCGLTALPTPLPDNLTTLNCGGNAFSGKLAVSSSSLTNLDCSFNPELTELDVSGCTSLTEIESSGCKITELTTDQGGHLKVTVLKGGVAYITGAEKDNGGNWTANLELSADPGYVESRNKTEDSVTVKKMSVSYDVIFKSIIEGFDNGQSFTKESQIPFTAKDVGKDKPASWTVRTSDGEDTGLGGKFAGATYSDTINTSSLSGGAYRLYINYGAGGNQGQGDDVAPGSNYIEFNIEESHYTGPSYYYLDVEHGSGDGAYTYNTRVDIAADPASEGQEFDKWVRTSGEGSIENADAEKTVYTMGFGNAVVTATYRDKTPVKPEKAKYQLTVRNGSGSGTYEAGTKVAIKAEKAEKGMEFEKWILIDGKGFIKEPGSSNTTFTMAESDATVKAVYKKQTATPAKSGDPDKPSKPGNQKGHENPETGDTQMLFAWMSILAAAATGIYILNRKKNELEE